MKLIKIDTRHTDEEFGNLVKPNQVESDILVNILSGVDFVEFLDENGFSSIICIVSDYTTKRLVDVYVNLSIDFSIEDLTKKVLFSEKVKSDYSDDGVNVSSEINKLINKFYINNTDVDTILDKISYRGIKSLTPVDRDILNNF